MNAIIQQQGGGGIVVSRHEVLQRYPMLRELLGPGGVHLPADPWELREWSLVMAFTGLLNAIDRDLLDEKDILVHGSGSYHTGDFTPIPPDRRTAVTGLDDLLRVTRQAAGTGVTLSTP
jgi:hypothetical protein